MTDSFAKRLLAWFDRHGRHDLPWQQPRTAYRVWVSEVMLQQTQVATVIPYYQRFMARFANVQALAEASQDAVLEHWAGLGYYSRARNLHRAAQIIHSEHAGQFPADIEQAMALPGVGPSTAAAILAQAYGQRHAILDGNVKRVLSRYHAVHGWAGQASVLNQLWAHAEAHTPHQRLADYTQAIMDLGATVCVRGNPRCNTCPLMADCAAHAQNLTAELPTPRPRRERPQRHARMLVICNPAGEVLLQKRPPTGIWGGLWSLPEVPENHETIDFCASHLALQVSAPRPVEAIKHGFTHFELTIQPLLVNLLEAAPGLRESSEQIWYRPDPAGPVPALPAPLSKLLHGKMLASMITQTSQD